MAKCSLWYLFWYFLILSCKHYKSKKINALKYCSPFCCYASNYYYYNNYGSKVADQCPQNLMKTFVHRRSNFVLCYRECDIFDLVFSTETLFQHNTLVLKQTRCLLHVQRFPFFHIQIYHGTWILWRNKSELTNERKRSIYKKGVALLKFRRILLPAATKISIKNINIDLCTR